MMKKAVIWNSASSMINAGQSALILIFISHFLGIESAGIFTIAYAVANLTYAIAKYGVRNFQVTDISEKYAFSCYVKMRWITVSATFLGGLLYLGYQYFFNGDGISKVLVILEIIVWKMIDAIEDVYYGMYQQRGRLDIGAKYYTYRLMASTGLYCVLIVCGFSLLKSTTIVLICSAVLAYFYVHKSLPMLRVLDKPEKSNGTLRSLFWECTSLCIGTSLAIYIGNAPKYMIDSCMDEKTQGYFGILIMPAFVIMILNNFIYQPIIRNLGEMWNNKEYKAFFKRVFVQCVVVLLLTAIVIAAGAVVGLPLLSWLYGVDLMQFRGSFILLLLGGGIYALVSFIMVPLTTMRYQNCISFGFLGVSIMTFLFGDYLVKGWGITGASVLYVCINLVLAVYLTICFVYKFKREERAIFTQRNEETNYEQSSIN